MPLRLAIVDALKETPHHFITTYRQCLLRNDALRGRTASSDAII
jgi:hypothetical protein